MKIKYFLAYSLSYGIWAVWRLTGGFFPPSGLAASFAIEATVKALIWVVPIFFVFRKAESRLIPLREGFCTPFPWYPTLIGLCMTVTFLHTAHIFLSGIDTWGIFQPIWFFMSLSAAVIEEIAFRGLLFNGQAGVHGVRTAAVFNGIMFAVYHYPEFLIGQSLSAVFGLRFWVITIMGIVFSLSFARWRNLLMNIVIHFVWNMLCFWFALA
jgi:membrane protease YdiL (CAAX protease family)